MRRAFIFAFFTIILMQTPSAIAQGGRRIVMAGDSWAWLMCLNLSMHQALLQNGIYNAVIFGCPDATKPGVKAKDYLGKKEGRRMLELIRKEKPDVLFLSLGGNDFLYSWKKTMGVENEAALFENAKIAVKSVVDRVRSLSPNTKIIVSGYDYGNFKDFTQVGGYKRLFKRMGFPEPIDINSALYRLTERLVEIADQENVFYIHHMGLMHYYYGNVAEGLYPHTTPSPSEISPPNNLMQIGGNPHLVNPVEAMMGGKAYNDPFHLSRDGFFFLADHVIDMYMRNMLKAD